MPLARITTPLPEYYQRLAQDLRARGFDVETATPGQFFSVAADLEVTVRKCRPEDAAKLAAEASGTNDMCVLVTPGKGNGIRSIEMIVLEPETQAARSWITPAQVIEISSALVHGNEAVPVQASAEEDSKDMPCLKAGARRNWDDIAATTTRWMEAVTTGCHAAWVTTKESLAPLGSFLVEVGEETRSLGRRFRAAVVARMDRKKSRDAAEQLVPSMFELSDELRDETEVAVVEKVIPISEPQRKLAGDARFWKAGSAAGVAAIGILVAITITHRAPRPRNEASSEVKVTGSAPVITKPAALIERGGQKPSPSSGLHMIAAKQAIPGDSEADDTVVRYFKRPAAAKRGDSHPQIKRYSDLD